VRPPDDVLAAVEAMVARGRAAGPGPRWAPREQWHVTLQFLGPVAELAPVVEALRAVGRIPAFRLRLGGGGAFPSLRRGRVVWIGAVEGASEVGGLAGAVAAALAPLGYEADRGVYRCHLTVARMREPGNVSAVVAALGDGPVGPAFVVSELVLYESRLSPKGSTYTALARVPLAPGA
jgi:RNA 2',3'-cyclic 3'-phosphodiesterase